MLRLMKRIFESYISTAGNYPLPMVWTV